MPDARAGRRQAREQSGWALCCRAAAALQLTAFASCTQLGCPPLPPTPPQPYTMAVLEEQLKKAYRTVTEGKFRCAHGLVDWLGRIASVMLGGQRVCCTAGPGWWRCPEHSS